MILCLFAVPDLKAELKRRSLPVSGPKPILIERLKQHFELLARQQATPTQPPLSGVPPVRRTTITTIGGVTVGAGGQLFRRSSKESSPLEIGKSFRKLYSLNKSLLCCCTLSCQLA